MISELSVSNDRDLAASESTTTVAMGTSSDGSAYSQLSSLTVAVVPTHSATF